MTRDYDLLLIESNETIADEIINSLEKEDISASVAESKSLIKAETLLTSANLNFLIFGPSLTKTSLIEFFKKNKITEKISSIVMVRKDEESFALEAKDAGITNLLSFPYKLGELKTALELSKKNFNTQAYKTLTTDSIATAKVGRARQLSLILDRLAKRLTNFSNALKALPIDSDIQQASLPEAVNKVILETTQFRKDKETEDLNNLVNKIVTRSPTIKKS